MRRVGNNSIEFDDVYLISKAVVTGPKEQVGPIGNHFDYSYDDIHCDGNTWEQAEMNLLKKAYSIALSKAGLVEENIDVLIGGDLNNQIAVTSYAMRESFIPYLGTFAACSTFTENLILGSILIDSNLFRYVTCVTSSHNATSERQFRYPTEYGGQKPLSMTFTTTAAGCAILGKKPSKIRITKGTIGKIIDVGLKDAQDMGRTMAPAAVVTMFNHFQNFNETIENYDLIVTGDLSKYGSDIFEKCCLERGINITKKHIDAGITLYNQEKQDVYAGGSGCGCITAVTLGYLINLLNQGLYKKILVLATGALLNPVMTAQKESIPCISHAIVLERS